MKILYVLRSFAMMAGTERVMASKICWLATHGYDVMMVTYEQGNHPPAFPLPDNVKCQDLDVRFFKLQQLPLLRRYFAYRHMKSLFRERLQEVVSNFRPDFISTTAYSLKIADDVVAVKGNAQLILEAHDTCDSLFKEYDYRSSLFMRHVARVYDLQYYRIINRFHYLVTLTEGDAALWRRRVKTPVVVIPNPLPVSPCILKQPVVNRPLRIIAVGRLEPVKGFDILVRSFARVAGEFPQWQLAIFGQGSQQSSLHQLVHGLGMNSRITIYKPTSDIWREYQQSDIYVLTSLREAFGMVLIEAMSYGLPCIAFDSPFGPAEIITDGVNGRLVPVGNESALTDSLRWLMTHDDERLRMGRQARESIRRFEIDAVMKRWQELFVTGETSA